jgi:hypothetical protein
MIKNKFSYLALATFAATSLAFAQGVDVNANVNVDAQVNAGGMPPPPPQGGGQPGQRGEFMNRFMHGWRGQDGDQRPPRNDNDDRGQGGPRGEWKEDMQMMMNASGTATSTRAMWGMKMRSDMRAMVASITDVQANTIAAKLGITVAELRAKLASGTPLREIINGKITREEMMQIFPMMGSTTASGTMGHWDNGNRNGEGPRQHPQGLLNSLRNLFFGGQGDNNMPPPQGEGNVEANANANANVQAGFGGFFKRFFNF